MRTWILYQLLIIWWSSYLIALHLSHKDHELFRGILFLCWAYTGAVIMKKWGADSTRRLLHSFIAGGFVCVGDFLYLMLIGGV
ncbi:hypothetical protein JOC33_001817 [Thalassobacillus pellis]|nr:hypothetical protein [Thalassobacillus pellis]